MSTPSAPPARPQPHRATMAARLDVACRILVAVPGNYAATGLAVCASARVLPGSALSATLTATLLSFVVFAAGVVATFAARDGLRAAAWLAGIAAVLAAALAATGGAP